jgi:hypothetical protein
VTTVDTAPLHTYTEGTTVDDAFQTTRRRYRGMSGGTTAGPDDYIIVSTRPISVADARVLADLLLANNDSRVHHLGAVGAIAVHSPDAAILPQVPGLVAPPDGWLFVGWTHPRPPWP